MKILLVSPYLPHPSVPHAGGKFIHMVLEWLDGRHRVDLVARVFPGEEKHEATAASLSGRFLPVRSGISADPVRGSVRGRIASYRRLAREAARAASGERYDVVLVEYTEAGIFLSTVGLPPAVLDCHDIITKPWYRRWRGASGPSLALWGGVYLALSAAERRTARRFRTILVRSHEDARWAEREIGHPDIRVVPHPAGADLTLAPREEFPGRILFLGAMGRQLNVDAALFFHEKVFPLVRARFPEAEFWIVGGNPPPVLRELPGKDRSVRVTGFVEDIGEAYRKAAVFAAPILVGGGIIVKILDAMAAGVPVVTTTYGNEGIGAAAGEELFVADSPEGFAEKVVSLLGDSDLRRRIGERGKEFVRGTYEKERILRNLEGILSEAASGPPSSPTSSGR